MIRISRWRFHFRRQNICPKIWINMRKCVIGFWLFQWTKKLIRYKGNRNEMNRVLVCFQLLPGDDRGLYESSLSGLKSPALTALPCVVTGYPVLTGSGRSPVTFTKPGRVANREDWIVLNKTAKDAGGSHLNDVLTYLSAWCGTATMYTF